jgi:GT2 family glycosyltransferase/serine acetyltransferase
MKLLTVIVNHRTANLTVDALASLSTQPELASGCRAVVVDNASGDGSADRIEGAIADHAWKDWVELVRSPRNGGFAAGNNLAIRAALDGADPPALVLLLNPDTMVRPGALEALLSFMDGHPEVGIAGCRLEELDGTPQASAFRFPGVLGELESALRTRPASWLLGRWAVAPPPPAQACQVDWVAGAAMVIRREVLEQVGLLDEGYFLYFEEVDYCLRARRAGWPCWHVPESRVVHLRGRSSGVTDPRQARRRRPQYWFASRRRYFVRNLGLLRAGLADVAFTAGHVVSRTARALRGRPAIDPEKFLTDFVRNSLFAAGPALPGAQDDPPSLLGQVQEDWQAHGRSFTSPGFQAVAVHRFGNWRMGIQRKLLRAPFSVLYRCLYRRVRDRYGIELPYSVKLGRRVIFEHQSGVVIHGNATIGDDCIIRQGVTLGNRRLDAPFDAPELGRRVNVGAGAKILGAVKVGDDASIGANAVVCQDVPACTSAVGVPARIVPPRDDDEEVKPWLASFRSARRRLRARAEYGRSLVPRTPPPGRSRRD